MLIISEAKRQRADTKMSDEFGRFGAAVTAFVTSTKLCYVEPG